MPKIVKIHTENDVFQNIETLRRNRDKRNKLGQFFVEGVRNINNALEFDWKIHAFVYSPEKNLSGWATDILKKSKAQFHYELPIKLLQKLSNKEDTSELLAVIDIPKDDVNRIPVDDDFLVVVFDRPASPGNLGTLIRSSDALGVDGLIVTGHAVDIYDPEAVRATTGSLFSVPVIRLPSQKELLPWITQIKKKFKNLQIIGTDEKGEQDIAEHDFKQPTVLLVGNETWGLSAAYKDICDVLVKIPMHGSASSLNVACASSIILYEVDRQRRRI